MEDGSTGLAGPAGPGTAQAPPDNRRQAALILLTMAAFFVGLVVLACWAAKNG